MKITVFLTLLTSLIAFGQSRSPAVEPFTEISKDVKELNKKLGPIAAFNFKAHAQAKLNQYNKERAEAKTESTSFTLTTLLILLGLISLPFAGWQFVMATYDKQAQDNKVVELKIISKYDESESVFNKSKDKNSDKSDDEEDYKKAA